MTQKSCRDNIIIAGITRSGLTATCQMLSAGGLDVAGKYPAFEPYGIGQIPWPSIKGKVVKLVDSHLHFHPSGHYSVIRLYRDLDQQVKSFCKWLRAFGYNPQPSQGLIESFKRDYELIDEWASAQDKLMFLRFESMISDPRVAAESLSEFLEVDIDVSKAADAIIKRSPECHPTLLELEMVSNADSDD